MILIENGVNCIRILILKHVWGAIDGHSDIVVLVIVGYISVKFKNRKYNYVNLI